MRKNRTGLPKGLTWTTDRHGKPRLRYFGRGFSIYIHAPFGSPEYAAEYAAAEARNRMMTAAAAKPIGADRTIPGSIGALVVSYFELVLPLKKARARERLGAASWRSFVPSTAIAVSLAQAGNCSKPSS